MMSPCTLAEGMLLAAAVWMVDQINLNVVAFGDFGFAEWGSGSGSWSEEGIFVTQCE